MAMHSGGILQLLHVIEINPLTAEGATEGLAPQELYAVQVESAQKRVSEMLAELPSNVECKVTIQVGEPGDQIIDVAKTMQADLIVMATHGRKGLKHLFLGSVAERVIKEAPAPVLIVRSNQAP